MHFGDWDSQVVKAVRLLILYGLLLSAIRIATSQQWLSRDSQALISYCKNHKKTTAISIGIIGFVLYVKGFVYFIDKVQDKISEDIFFNEKNKNSNKKIFFCPELDGDLPKVEFSNSYQLYLQLYNHDKKGMSRMDLQKDIVSFLNSLKNSCEEDDEDENKRDQIQYNIFGQSYGGYVLLAALDALQDEESNLLAEVEISNEQRTIICEKLKRGIIYIDSPFFDFKSGLYGFTEFLKSEQFGENLIESGRLIHRIGTSLLFSLFKHCASFLYYIILPIATNFRIYPGRFKSFQQGIHENCFKEFRIILSTHENDPVSGGKISCQNFISLSSENNYLNIINNEFKREEQVDKVVIGGDGKQTRYLSYKYSVENDFIEHIHNNLKPQMPVLIVHNSGDKPEKDHLLPNAIATFKGLIEKNQNISI